MRKMAKSRDGVRLKKGDKAWYETNAGLMEVSVGEPLPWCGKWIAQLKYCWAAAQREASHEEGQGTSPRGFRDALRQTTDRVIG